MQIADSIFAFAIVCRISVPTHNCHVFNKINLVFRKAEGDDFFGRAGTSDRSG